MQESRLCNATKDSLCDAGADPGISEGGWGGAGGCTLL